MVYPSLGGQMMGGQMMGGQMMGGRQKISLPCITALKLDLKLHLSDVATESDFVHTLTMGGRLKVSKDAHRQSLFTIPGHDTGIRTDHVYIDVV
jgi:hypothetical protein